MKYTDEAKQNFKALSNNPYPGRGIILGESADGKNYVRDEELSPAELEAKYA
jgi:hypothetical protein